MTGWRLALYFSAPSAPDSDFKRLSNFDTFQSVRLGKFTRLKFDALRARCDEESGRDGGNGDERRGLWCLGALRLPRFESAWLTETCRWARNTRFDQGDSRTNHALPPFMGRRSPAQHSHLMFGTEALTHSLTHALWLLSASCLRFVSGRKRGQHVFRRSPVLFCSKKTHGLRF